eukprot:768451-Hanusia_phi.AAC.2
MSEPSRGGGRREGVLHAQPKLELGVLKIVTCTEGRASSDGTRGRRRKGQRRGWVRGPRAQRAPGESGRPARHRQPPKQLSVAQTRQAGKRTSSASALTAPSLGSA